MRGLKVREGEWDERDAREEGEMNVMERGRL